MGRTVGVGAALRAGYAYAVRRGYDVAVVMAGNNKDAPEEIPLLLDPIADGRADFVQGSRWLKRGANFGQMPFYRRIATRLHPLLFSLAARRRVTESTNGFRAVRREVLLDPRLNLEQPWLDEYELEPYLYLRAIQLGWRTAEVPVTRSTRPGESVETKMKPITGWWSILRPILYVAWASSDEVSMIRVAVFARRPLGPNLISRPHPRGAGSPGSSTLDAGDRPGPLGIRTCRWRPPRTPRSGSAVNAVVICADRHAPWPGQGRPADKHVLVEKPITARIRVRSSAGWRRRRGSCCWSGTSSSTTRRCAS
jgi:dolichol-phosphate mannosyltransferase